MRKIIHYIPQPGLGAAIALALSTTSALALPVITKVVETGGDNEATDTVVAHFTGETFSNGIAGEFQNPFTVPPFGEDVPAYVDRAHQWNGATGTLPLPDYLVGGEYIMSGNDNRDNASYKLVVTLSSPALVYLLIDNRLQDATAADPPTFDPNMLWVTEQGWQPVLNGLNRNGDNTIPDEVGVDESGDGTGPGASIQNWSSVYVKQFPAGDFELLQADNAGQNMYGVIVTRLSSSTENPPKITDFSPTNNALFVSAASGIHFSASTVTPNNIASSNISLILNGTDVSSQLAVSGSGTARTVAFSGLSSNTLYNARVFVSDQAGRGTTNSYVFDTFNEGSALAIEAEDYNYQGGQFKDGTAVNAFDSLSGTPEIDIHTANRITTTANYRVGDFSGIATSTDTARSKFANGGTDYVVNNIYAGDWFNYTRDFPSNQYQVYLRAGAAGTQQVRLDSVTGATTTNQTTAPIGLFNLSSGGLAYAPLTDANGNSLVVTLSGPTTLRLTSLGGNANLQYNYLLLVPTSAAASAAYLASISPVPGVQNAGPDAAVRIVIAPGSTGFSAGTAALTFNGSAVTPTVASTAEGTVLTYDPPGNLPTGTNIPVTLTFKDSTGTTISNGWFFAGTASVTTIPATFGTPISSGQGNGFIIHIHKASNDAGTGTPPALPQTVARAISQLNGTLIDPNTTAPYENEAAGPNGDGLATNAVVNFEQAATAAGFIPGDEAFPYIEAGDPNNIALEALAYLELKAGMHRFGVVSDDAFRVSTGPVLTNANDLVLGIFDAGRGAGLPGGATEFDFFAEQDGLYPVRLLYDEGQGGASVEFYSIDLNTFERILINDRSNPRAVKAYTGRSTQVFVPTVTITGLTNDMLFPTAPTNLTLTVNAALTGGTITKVEYFAGTNKLGESVTAPFSLNVPSVEAGRYTLTAKATGDNGLTATSEAVSFIVGTPVLRINFQAATTETPEGYLADTGEVYDDRGNGQTYGWDVDNTANARERNSANSPNKLYDTFNHMQKPLPAGRVWEVAIPNGRYKVYGVSGDPDNTDSVFDVQVEGVTFILGTPTTATHFYDGTGVVTVSDGKLTISNGPTATNSKINFLDIWALSPDEGPGPLNNPTVSGSTITVTWAGGGVLEATPDLRAPATWTQVGTGGTYSETISGLAKFFRVRK